MAAAGIAVLLTVSLWERVFVPTANDPHGLQISPAVSGPPPTSLPGEPIQVDVLNGCGASQIAARLTRKARELGLDVVDEGNAGSFAFLRSMVIDRRGDMNKAREVAALLGIPICIQQITRDRSVLAEVSIIIGHDYEELGLLGP